MSLCTLSLYSHALYKLCSVLFFTFLCHWRWIKNWSEISGKKLSFLLSDTVHSIVKQISFSNYTACVCDVFKESDDYVLKNDIYSSQICNFLCRKQYIINIITENKNHCDYSLAKTDVTLSFFIFLKVKTLKTRYFEKKPSILDKFQWSH